MVLETKPKAKGDNKTPNAKPLSDPKYVDTFKTVLSATLRAVAHKKTLSVSFSPANNHGQTNTESTEVILPVPPNKMNQENLIRLRGIADATSMRILYHDEALHKKRSPKSTEAIAIYNALEEGRVEILGSQKYRGVAKNLSNLIEQRLVLEGYPLAKRLEQIQLDDALKVMLYAEDSSLPIGKTGKHINTIIKKKYGASLQPLIKTLIDNKKNQDEYARTLRKIIETLNIEKDEGAEQVEDEKSPESQGDTKDESENAPGEKNNSEESGHENTEETSDRHSEQMSDESFVESLDEEDSAIHMDQDRESVDGGRHSTGESENNQFNSIKNYKIYSENFDQIVEPTELCDSEELNRLRLQLDRQLSNIQGMVSRLANKLQRKLMAKQTRSWEFDLEEGILDTGRLARVVANPAHPLSFKSEKEIEFRDTVVSLLIDNSGSMRGRPITIAAMSADILARTLERCGVKVEILGFTTNQWKGGESRKHWLEMGKPPKPGRLNDLRHIIYKGADMPWRRARKGLGLMLREGILKENIDGEALIWAHNRLLNRREVRRILMVISDGAPVDDSTLSVNPGNYLEKHLRDVIGFIENYSPIRLVAIGIGHDVTKYYRKAVTLMDVEELGGALTNQLTELFDEEDKPLKNPPSKKALLPEKQKK